MPSPTRDVSTSTLPSSHPSELLPVPTHFSPAPVSHYIQPVLIAHLVHSAPASATCPIVTALATHHAHTALVSHPVHAVDHPDHTALVLCHVAPAVHQSPTALPPFTFCLMFVPLISSPTPLPFPLCPMPTLTVSITAQAQPSPITLTHYDILSVPHNPYKVNSDPRHTPVEVQKQKESHFSHHCETKENVAIQKEEERG